MLWPTLEHWPKVPNDTSRRGVVLHLKHCMNNIYNNPNPLTTNFMANFVLNDVMQDIVGVSCFALQAIPTGIVLKINGQREFKFR